MRHEVNLREARPEDKAEIRELVTRAFGRADEANIVDKLEAEGASYLQIVAELDGKIVGHLTFYNVGVLGKLGALGLGPMSVDPWVQREGVGLTMARFGLQVCKNANVPIVFVLGHPEYYPKLGFSAEATKGFGSPWAGEPAFMALRMKYGPPMSGKLIFPAAFGV